MSMIASWSPSWHGKTKSESIFQTLTCVLLLASLPHLAACKTSKSAKGDKRAGTPVQIVISKGCKGPATDPVTVLKSHGVSWISGDGTQYTITFNPKLDSQSSSGTPTNITPNPNVLSVPPTGNTPVFWNTSNVPAKDCNDTALGTTGCLFKYNIYTQTSTGDLILCADPGVLVQPDGSDKPPLPDGQKGH
jgi:hypothetical protein